MFDTEVLKRSVLDKYIMSRSSVSRRFQRAPLTFREHQLKVSQADEPNGIFWENLDYPHKRRLARKSFFWFLRVMLLLLLLIVAGKLTTLPNSSAKIAGSETWVFQGQANQNSCTKVCHPEISEEATCENYVKLGVGQEQSVYTSCCSSQTITNSSVDTCLAQSSATCYSTSFVVVDHGSLVTPNCFKVVMPREQSTAFMMQQAGLQIYGCDSGFTANDDPRQNCQLMSIEEITLTQDANAAIDTVRVHLGLQVGCDGGTPTIEKARAAKAMLGPEHSVEDSRLQCFCKQEYKKQGTFFLLGPYNTEEKRLCKEWSDLQAAATLQYSLGIFLVVIMNNVLWLLITTFDSLSKHRSLSSITNSQVSEITASQFVNTGLLLLLVSLHTYGLFSSFGFLKEWVGNGPHDDFTTAWHTQNGSSLILTLGSTIACALAFTIVSVWPTVPLFVWWFKKGAVTRKTMNELYLLPQFPYSSRLAASNCILFVVVMYSGAMPILYLVGFLYFVSSYWIDKWCLLRGSARPPPFNHEAVLGSVSMWYCAAALHVVMACAMFTPSVFPSEWSWFKDIVFGILNEEDELYSETLLLWETSPRTVRSEYYVDWIRGRVSDVGRRCCWLQVVIVLVFCTISGSAFLLKLFNFYGVIKGKYFSTCQRKKQAALENYDQGLALAKESNSVFSYTLKASKVYADAYKALRYNPEPIHYTEVIQVKSKEGIIGSKSVSAHRVDRARIDGGLIVTIQGAKGLRNADTFGKSDPFCKCVVIGNPMSAFKTNTVRNDCNPYWLYERHVTRWAPGDGLRFEVFDSGKVSSSEGLGWVELKYIKFMFQGFEGELELLEAGEGITATLHVKVEVLDEFIPMMAA